MTSSEPKVAQAASWKVLALVGAVAFGARLALFLLGPMADVSRAFEADTDRYIALAENLRTTHTFALDHGESPDTVYYPVQALREEQGQVIERDGVWPEGIRTPGYPVFLLPFVGWGAGLHVVLFVQCLLSALSAMLIAWIGGALGLLSWQAAVAGLILAVHPSDALFANVLLTETLSAFCMTAGLALLLLAIRRRPGIRWTTLCLGGVLLGLTCLVRPSSLAMGPALAVWLLIVLRSRAGLAACLAVGLLSVLPAGVWSWRNHREGLGFRLSTVTAIHAARTASFMTMNDTGPFEYPKDFWPHYDDFFAQVRAEIRPHESADAAIARVARERIRANPASYARLMIRSASKTLTDHTAGHLYRMLGQDGYEPSGLRNQLLTGQASWRDVFTASMMVSLLWTGGNILLAVLAGVGLLRLAIRRQGTCLLLLAGVMLYFLFAAQYHGDVRMHLPMLGLQAIAAAFALSPRRRKAKACEPKASNQ